MRKWLILGITVCVLAAYLVVSHFIGGPRDIYGFVRYALPQWHRGDLQVGDRAPDARLVSPDARKTFYLHDWIGKRPLVLVLGSYT